MHIFIEDIRYTHNCLGTTADISIFNRTRHGLSGRWTSHVCTCSHCLHMCGRACSNRHAVVQLQINMKIRLSIVFSFQICQAAPWEAAAKSVWYCGNTTPLVYMVFDISPSNFTPDCKKDFNRRRAWQKGLWVMKALPNQAALMLTRCRHQQADLPVGNRHSMTLAKNLVETRDAFRRYALLCGT